MSIASTLSNLSGKVLALTAGTVPHLSIDLVTDRATLIAGSTYHQITWSYTGVERRDSNILYYGYEVTIMIRHCLADPNNEVAFTSGADMDTIFRALGDEAWYPTGNSNFYAMQDSPAITLIAPEREGNIISFGARAKILIKT